MADKKREFIDPNALMRYINEDHSYAGLPMAAHICTMELLTYAPRVDAVEVIRCRDCKYFDRGWCYISLLTKSRLYVPPLHMTKETAYCSCGERRTDA